jgi:hypothetical protein
MGAGNTGMSFPILAIVAVVAVLGGCAGFGSGRPSLMMRTRGASNELALAEGGVVGSRVQLAATTSGYHGFLHGQDVDLNADRGRITGAVGGRLVSLQVRSRHGGIAVNGLFNGRLGRVAATPDAITGGFGRCSYSLHAVGRDQGPDQGPDYEGWRVCGTLQPARVHLPPAFDQLSTERRAMLLVLLLNR